MIEQRRQELIQSAKTNCKYLYISFKGSVTANYPLLVDFFLLFIHSLGFIKITVMDSLDKSRSQNSP